MPLRIGVHHRVARAPERSRTAVEDAAALLSMHGHRVVDLAAGRSLRARLTGRAPTLAAVQVVLHIDPVGPDFPCVSTVPVDCPGDSPIHIGLSGRRGLAAEVRDLVRAILLDQPALAEASA